MKRALSLLALAASALLFQPVAFAQSQTRSPAAAGDCTNQPGIGTLAWTNPGNAISSNNGYASRSLDGTTSNYLQCLNYGFSIPAGATILGIEVNVERKSNRTSNGGSRDAAMRLVKGGVIQATDRSTATAYTTTDTVETHGTPTDLWGTTWSAADINAANFGAAFAAIKPSAAGAAHTVTVDHIEITVYYSFTNNPPPAPSLVSPADGATVTTGTPTFTWSAVVDPDGDTVTYDIQIDDSGCGFPSPEVNQTGLAATSFVPASALANATYCWRVRATDQWGAAGPWSATRSVTINAPLSQTRSPAAAGDCTNQAGIGTLAWANPGNAISSDNGYASRSLDGTTSNYLQCLNYGFSIPAGATILGIEVNVERKSNRTSNGGSRDAAMRLVRAGAIQAADRSTTTAYTTADTVETHGGPTDLWGSTWSPADINAANFGAAFAATKPSAAGAAHTVTVDHMEITVYYTLSAVAAPGDFNAFETSTAGGAIVGQVYTKLVSTGFTLDVVAILSGAQHMTFTDTVQVDLVTGSNGGLNCPGAPAAIGGTSQNVNLTTGRGTTGAFSVASAYTSVRVRVQYPVGSPAVTSCSTNAFTIRPTGFTGVASPTLTNAASSGLPRAKAGDAFDISATAVAGYNGTPLIDNTKITAHAGAIQAGGIGGAFLTANPASGTATGTTFTYSEVGNFTIGVNGVYDNAFTNGSLDQSEGDCTPDFSNSLVGGKYGCYFGNASASSVIGRFTPNHFDVVYNVPVFAPACTGFTYVGQTFNYSTAPVITVTARNAAGLGNAVTRNYQGAWRKITNATLSYPGGTDRGYRSFSGTFDTGGLPVTDPAIADGGAGAEGTVTLTFSAGTGLRFQRTAPVAPYDAEISLAINVLDEDGVALATNPAKFGNEVAGGGMVFTDLNPATTNDKSVRFGRLRVANARGSQLLPLRLLMELQYWNGSAFVTNTADACTSLAANNIEMANFTQNLSACETSLTVNPFVNGRATAQLATPGGPNRGSVTLVPWLETSVTGTPQTCVAGTLTPVVAANKPYLLGKWDSIDEGADGLLFDDNPEGRGTFGVYPGSGEVIFQQENF